MLQQRRDGPRWCHFFVFCFFFLISLFVFFFQVGIVICCPAGSLFEKTKQNKKTLSFSVFKRRLLLQRVRVASRVVSTCIGWQGRARCGRMNAERTEPSQGFVKSSRHLPNCMLVDDPPWHRFHSFLYDSILDSPGAAWKTQRANFSTPPVDREHMATKTGASHFPVGLLGSRFEHSRFHLI